MKSLISRLAMVAALAASGSAYAADKVIKIGVLTDMSGVYADAGGLGAVAATKLAVEDSGLLAKGWKIDVISADHQNKPDIAGNIARQWADQEHVDLIVDGINSGAGLAITVVAQDKNMAYINSGAASSDLTGKACTPNMVHWTYDTYMLANGTGKAIVKNGGDSWFFLTADYAFGQALERDTTAVITANGGKVVGSVRHPLSAPDFSSFLLQAQSSKAKIIGLANAGGDTSNSVKQAAEFGIMAGGQKLAALLMFLTDAHAIGLQTAQGLELTTPFYWDMNDGTRAFTKRFQANMANKQVPTMVHAGDYSGTLHYLKALEALGGNDHDGAKVIAKMKAMPTDDPLFGKGEIRVDGRKIHPGYLMEVKKPSESTSEWDLYKLVSTIPGSEAFRPLAESACPLVKK